MQLLDVHANSLATSSALSGYYMNTTVLPLPIISVLNAEGINFVLAGAHGVGGWMDDPRATQDVDVVVATRHHKKAIKALLSAFPILEADDHPAVTRLRDQNTKKVRIDIIKPTQQLFRDALKHTHVVTQEGQTYKIPSLEMALTMKFAAMISPHRQDEDKHQDAHDFIRIVKSNKEVDLQKLTTFGDLVYNGGGAELLEKVRQVRAGEKLNL